MENKDCDFVQSSVRLQKIFYSILQYCWLRQEPKETESRFLESSIKNLEKESLSHSLMELDRDLVKSLESLRDNLRENLRDSSRGSLSESF